MSSFSEMKEEWGQRKGGKEGEKKGKRNHKVQTEARQRKLESSGSTLISFLDVKFIFLGLDSFTSNDQMNSANFGKIQQIKWELHFSIFQLSRKTSPRQGIFHRVPMVMFVFTQDPESRSSSARLLHMKCGQHKFTSRRHLALPPNQPCTANNQLPLHFQLHNKYLIQACFIQVFQKLNEVLYSNYAGTIGFRL